MCFGYFVSVDNHVCVFSYMHNVYYPMNGKDLSFLLNVSIMDMSSSLRVKFSLKVPIFSFKRPGLDDFGIVETPSWNCQGNISLLALNLWENGTYKELSFLLCFQQKKVSTQAYSWEK